MADTAVATDKKTTFSYEDLLNQLNQYQAKTDDEIRALAEAQVNSQYDSARLNAQQAADRTTQALQQQLSALAPSYDRQLQENQLAYDRAYSRADRQALSRGMQRSSYNAQVLANLLQEGNRAAGDIQAARTAQENNINANISQTAQQLADQLAQLENNRQNDLKAAEDALRDREYNRGQAQNELLLNLYQLAEQYGHTTPSTSAGAGVTGGASSSGGYAYEMPESLKRQLGISTGSSERSSGSRTGASTSNNGSAYQQLVDSVGQQINYTSNGNAQTWYGSVPNLPKKDGTYISNNSKDYVDGATGKTPDISSDKVAVTVLDANGKPKTIYV